MYIEEKIYEEKVRLCSIYENVCYNANVVYVLFFSQKVVKECHSYFEYISIVLCTVAL